jgi:hypothetical protein
MFVRKKPAMMLWMPPARRRFFNWRGLAVNFACGALGVVAGILMGAFS